MSGFFRSAIVRPLLDAWLDRGGVPHALLHELGVTPASMLDPRAWLEQGACLRLVNELSTCSGDSVAGMHIADRVDWQILGSWAAGIVSAPTVGRALCRAAQKLEQLESSSRLELTTDRDTACLRFAYAPPFEDRPDQFLLADILTFKRIFGLGAEPIKVSVRTVVEKPREVDEALHLLGHDTEFGSAANEFVFDASALYMPLREDARSLVMKPGQSDDKRQTARDVASMIGQWLEFEPLTISLIARHLGMNVRTVQRHLGLWGISFEALLDEYRKEHAVELLCEQKYSVTDTAFRLGYSESGHFTRAFRRWFGVPPSRCDQIPARRPPSRFLAQSF